MDGSTQYASCGRCALATPAEPGGRVEDRVGKVDWCK